MPFACHPPSTALVESPRDARIVLQLLPYPHTHRTLASTAFAGARLLFAAGAFAAALASMNGLCAAAIELEADDQGLLFSEDGRPVVYYQRSPKSFDGAFTRNDYLHPLWGLDGQVLTEDGPEDHRHHRGIFWAWHWVSCGGRRLGDAWECRNFAWDVTDIRTMPKPDGAQELTATVLWKSPDLSNALGKADPVVRETTRILVCPRDGDRRVMDFDLRLEALHEEVEIGGSQDSKGYGGFSLRLVCPPDFAFVSTNGGVQPAENAVRAGPAMEFHGSFQPGKPSGVTLLCHPLNPLPTDSWILRASQSMQNAAFPGRDPIRLSPREPLRLRYRLLIHRGLLPPEEIKSAQAEYARSIP